MTHARIVCLGCMSNDDSHGPKCPMHAPGPVLANPMLMGGAFSIGSFIYGGAVTNLLTQELSECQECYAIVKSSSITLHADWHALQIERDRELQLRTDKRPPNRRT